MARRAKTIIKGQGSKAREQREASAQGQASVQRQDEFAGQQSTRALDRAGREGTQVASIIQRQGGLEEQAASRKQRAKIATGQQMQQERALELSERQAGYERGPGGDTPPLVGEERDRRAALEAEMGKGTAGEQQQPSAEQQGPQIGDLGGGPEASARDPEEVARLQEQGGKPVEIGGQGAAMPGREQGGGLRRSPEGIRKDVQSDYESQTRRLAVEGRIAATQNKVLQAEFANNEKERKRIMDTQLEHLDLQMDVFSRIKNGKATHGDWSTLFKWANDMGMKDNPGGKDLMDIIAAGAKTKMGPTGIQQQKRLEGFIQGYMDRSAMQFTATFGQTPSGFVLDSSPMMQAFANEQRKVVAWMQFLGPAFQMFGGIKSLRERNRYVNRFAAAMVLMGQSGSVGGGSFGQPQQAAPSAGGGQQGPSVGGGRASVMGGIEQAVMGGGEGQPGQPQQDLRPLLEEEVAGAATGSAAAGTQEFGDEERYGRYNPRRDKQEPKSRYFTK